MNGDVAFWLVIPFALVAGTIVHECGHWAMAAALRCEPRIVCLGVGRQVWQVRALGVHLVLRATPIGGHVLLAPMGRDRRNAYAAVIAAGPAANIVVASAALLAWRAWGGEGVVSAPVFVAIAGCQAISLANSLLPMVDATSGRPGSTDGRKLLAWAMGRDPDILAEAYAPIVARVAPERRPAMSPDFAEALFHSVRPDRHETWGRQQAMDGLRAVLARGRLNPYEHLAAQKRLQRDLEAELRTLIAEGEREGGVEG